MPGGAVVRFEHCGLLGRGQQGEGGGGRLGDGAAEADDALVPLRRVDAQRVMSVGQSRDGLDAEGRLLFEARSPQLDRRPDANVRRGRCGESELVDEEQYAMR